MLRELKRLCAHYGVNGSLVIFRPERNKKELLAEWIISNALQSGKLQKGQAVAEITAGNLGVALARECTKICSPLYLVPIGIFNDSVQEKLRIFPNVHIVEGETSRSFACLSATLERVVSEKNAYSFRQFSNASQLHFFRKILDENVRDISVDCVIDKIGTGATLQALTEKFTVGGKAPEALYATNCEGKIDTSYLKFFNEMPRQVFPKDSLEYAKNFEDALSKEENLTDLHYAKLTLFCALEWLKENPGKRVFVFIGD